MNTFPAPREFRLDPQYVRGGIYVAVGFVAIGGLAIWLNQIGLLRANPNPVTRVACCAILATLGLLPLRWRLIVDEQGVWRRRVWSWELWSWNDFSSGRLKYGFHDHSFVDPQRPWLRRTLSLGYLTSKDSDQVWRWIELVWQPPVPPACNEALHFRYYPILRARTIWFDGDRIRIGKGLRQKIYDWNDVESLEVCRARHDRPDFHQLRLTLPDRTVHLRRSMQYGWESRNWKDAEPEEIASFLAAHVPAKRQTVLGTSDSVRTPRELEARLRESNKRVRGLRWLQRLCVGSLAGVLLWGWVGFGWPRAIFAVVVLLLYFAVFRFLYRTALKAQGKLETEGTERGS